MRLTSRARFTDAAGLGGADRVWRQRPGGAVAATARQAVAADLWAGTGDAAAGEGAFDLGLRVQKALVAAAGFALGAAIVRWRGRHVVAARLLGA